MSEGGGVGAASRPRFENARSPPGGHSYGKNVAALRGCGGRSAIVNLLGE